MAVLDIRKGTLSDVRTPQPIKTRRCHSNERRVVLPRVIHRVPIGVSGRREAGTCRQGVDAQIASRSVRHAPFARSEQLLCRRLSGSSASLRLRLSFSVALLVENRLVRVGAGIRFGGLFHSSRCCQDAAMIVGCSDGYRRL